MRFQALLSFRRPHKKQTPQPLGLNPRTEDIFCPLIGCWGIPHHRETQTGSTSSNLGSVPARMREGSCLEGVKRVSSNRRRYQQLWVDTADRGKRQKTPGDAGGTAYVSQTRWARI